MRALFGLSLLAFVAFTEAEVKLIYSELFDQYDIQGRHEVPLAMCKTGCYVYASVPRTLSGFEKNLWIVDRNTSARMMDIATLANSTEGLMFAKYKLAIPKNHMISIMNENPNQECSTVVIYVVSMTIGVDIYTPPPVYDVKMVPFTHGNGNSVMLMGAEYFTLFSWFFSRTPDYYTGSKKLVVQVLPSGFDASSSFSADGCLPIYITQSWNKDEIYIPIRSPLATISWSYNLEYNMNWKLGTDDNIQINGDVDTGVISSGYTGCPVQRKPYRYSLVNATTHTHFQATKPMKYVISTDLMIEQDNPVRITSDNGDHFELWGSFENGGDHKFQTVSITGKNVAVDWEDKYANSTFMLRIHVSDPSLSTSPSPSSIATVSSSPSNMPSTSAMDPTTRAAMAFSGLVPLLMAVLTFVLRWQA